MRLLRVAVMSVIIGSRASYLNLGKSFRTTSRIVTVPRSAGGPTYKTWNQFQSGTAGQFASRAEAASAWRIYKEANGIVTGTTHYVLPRMADGDDYDVALAEAQRLGFAEADPTADVSGADAASKAAILASLAFGTWVGIEDVYREGIEALSVEDIEFARFMNHEVKLLAIATQSEAGVSARVHPTLVPVDHALAAIRGATNAIFITGPSVDELLFAGPGAGGEPTATAVLGDVIDAAREILAGAQVAPRIRFSPGELLDFGDVQTRWYVRLVVEDEPGVLAQIATAFGESNVSIKSVWQEGEGSGAMLLIITHKADESSQRTAVERVRNLDVVRSVGAAIRVESPDV